MMSFFSFFRKNYLVTIKIGITVSVRKCDDIFFSFQISLIFSTVPYRTYLSFRTNVFFFWKWYGSSKTKNRNFCSIFFSCWDSIHPKKKSLSYRTVLRKYNHFSLKGNEKTIHTMQCRIICTIILYSCHKKFILQLVMYSRNDGFNL